MRKSPSWPVGSAATQSITDGAWLPGAAHMAAALATGLVFGGQACVAGLVLAGSAEFKNELSESDLFDGRLKALVLAVVDVSYGERRFLPLFLSFLLLCCPHTRTVCAPSFAARAPHIYTMVHIRSYNIYYYMGHIIYANKVGFHGPKYERNHHV